jgi:hypothetical protein
VKKHNSWILAAALLICTATPHLVHADILPKSPRTPVIVELFTSEGCSDCPAADQLLAHLKAAQPYKGAKIIALEEHVDYWNNSRHWVDPFSSNIFTVRQNAYSDDFGDNSVYTPEMVVNGRKRFVGSDSVAAAAAIVKESKQIAAKINLTQSMTGRADTVTVTVADLPKPDDFNLNVLVALTEDGLRSHVIDGENKGKTLLHSAVVRDLLTVGSIAPDGIPQTFTQIIHLSSEWQVHHLATIAFVQDTQTGAIYGGIESRLIP